MEQAAEARLIGEGLRQQPEASDPIAFANVNEGGRAASASLLRAITSVSGAMSGAG